MTKTAGASRLNNLLTKNSQQTTIDAYAYTFDRVGNRTAMTTPAGLHSYTYDSLYQLTGATHPDQQPENYAYDPVGNRNPLTYQHSAWNQILEDESSTYTYDDNGNRTERAAKNGSLRDVYVWNAENRLIRFERYDSLSSTIPTTTATYTYDALGRRIGKDVNGTTTGYVYDGIHIIAERDANNAVTTSYVHGIGIDEPISMTRGNAAYYYHRDALGSITKLTDAAGALVQEYQYDSFGNIVYTQNPAFIQPFTFTGREYDPESGLYHYRFRNYDPQTGTFIRVDPISFRAGDVNLMRYIGNNPVNWIDPLGLKKCIVEVYIVHGNPNYLLPNANATGAFDTGPSNPNKYGIIDHSVAIIERQFGFANKSSMRPYIDKYSIKIGNDTSAWVIRDHIDDEDLQKQLGFKKPSIKATNAVQDEWIKRGGGNRVILEVNGGYIPVGNNRAEIEVPDDMPCPAQPCGGGSK